MNVKGLIEADSLKRAVRRKPAFDAVANYASVLKKLARREDPSRISFDGMDHCEYNLYTSADGVPAVLLWDSSSAPLNENNYRDVALKVDGVQFDSPVWYDIRTGEIRDLESLDTVTIYDSPVMITEKSNIE